MESSKPLTTGESFASTVAEENSIQQPPDGVTTTSTTTGASSEPFLVAQAYPATTRESISITSKVATPFDITTDPGTVKVEDAFGDDASTFDTANPELGSPKHTPMDAEEAEIYDMVDAVVHREDDPTLPVLTFRVIVLGGFFGLLIFRTNSFSTNAFIGVLLAYPIGKFMEKVLPKGILNPGPFNYKEHTLIYVICSCTASPEYQLYQENLTDVAAVFFAINTQIVGYGLAGLCRRYLVKPSKMVWPTTLSVCAMLNSLHERPHSTATDGIPTDRSLRRTRYAHFWLVTFACAAWQLLPGYIMPILSAISILCYIAPATPNPQLTRILGSAYQGYGMLSLSFDWNVISAMAPITTPLWALMNQVFGLWLMAWVVTPILWQRDAFGMDSQLGASPRYGPNGTGMFPLGQAVNTPALFDREGRPVSPHNFVKPPNLVLDEDFYNAHKPIYITTMFAVEYFASFVVFVAAIVHVALWYSKDIIARFKSTLAELDTQDIHARLMSVYPEVPDLWYIIVLSVNVLISILVCQFGGFDLPWWGVILGLALAVVSVLPLGIILAISGQLIGLNVMSEFLIGLILPGRTAAVMSFKTLSFMAMAQGLFLVADLKLGHYMKIPPRIMFGTQLVFTVLAAMINVFVAKGIYESFGKVCTLNDDGLNQCNIWKLQTPDAPLGWTATNYNVFIRAGAIWGAKNENEASRIFPFWFGNPIDGDACSPDWFLRCSENERWGNSWGKKYYMIEEMDAYCVGLNFMNRTGSERERALGDGIFLDEVSRVWFRMFDVDGFWLGKVGLQYKYGGSL
ncbi:OPT oligopeptide transporter protein-domain-containing protein [Chytridium lagenaria]|nr:OPT oligopeptide transporter protein-domain-containing protein [Chytridium lagenaria]